MFHSQPALLRKPYELACWATSQLENWLTPLFDLAIRLFIGEIFFRAGVLKISDWASTLDLFHYVYAVPVVPPHLAAVGGTAGELLLPVFLVLGLGGRFAALGLSVMNVVAAISFPDISDLGLRDHFLWGALLLTSLFHGPGRISLDAFFNHRWRADAN